MNINIYIWKCSPFFLISDIKLIKAVFSGLLNSQYFPTTNWKSHSTWNVSILNFADCYFNFTPFNFVFTISTCNFFLLIKTNKNKPQNYFYCSGASFKKLRLYGLVTASGAVQHQCIKTFTGWDGEKIPENVKVWKFSFKTVQLPRKVADLYSDRPKLNYGKLASFRHTLATAKKDYDRGFTVLLQSSFPLIKRLFIIDNQQTARKTLSLAVLPECIETTRTMWGLFKVPLFLLRALQFNKAIGKTF